MFKKGKRGNGLLKSQNWPFFQSQSQEMSSQSELEPDSSRHILHLGLERGEGEEKDGRHGRISWGNHGSSGVSLRSAIPYWLPLYALREVSGPKGHLGAGRPQVRFSMKESIYAIG